MNDASWYAFPPATYRALAGEATRRPLPTGWGYSALDAHRVAAEGPRESVEITMGPPGRGLRVTPTARPHEWSHGHNVEEAIERFYGWIAHLAGVPQLSVAEAAAFMRVEHPSRPDVALEVGDLLPDNTRVVATDKGRWVRVGRTDKGVFAVVRGSASTRENPRGQLVAPIRENCGCGGGSPDEGAIRAALANPRRGSNALQALYGAVAADDQRRAWAQQPPETYLMRVRGPDPSVKSARYPQWRAIVDGTNAYEGTHDAANDVLRRAGMPPTKAPLYDEYARRWLLPHEHTQGLSPYADTLWTESDHARWQQEHGATRSNPVGADWARLEGADHDIRLPDVRVEHAHPGHTYVPQHGIAASLAVLDEGGQPIGWIDTETLGHPNARSWMAARDASRGAPMRANGVYDPGILKAVFLAGGPGSGKSHVAAELFDFGRGHGLHISSPLGLKSVNSDPAFELYLRQMGIDPKDLGTMPPEQFAAVTQGPDSPRGRAKHVKESQVAAWTEGRLGLVLDGTGEDYKGIAEKREYLERLGYDTFMVFVNTSLPIALERNAARARSLPVDLVESVWSAVQNNLGAFQRLFGAGDMVIVDNTTRGPRPADIQRAVNAFLRKPVQNHIGRAWVQAELRKRGGQPAAPTRANHHLSVGTPVRHARLGHGTVAQSLAGDWYRVSFATGEAQVSGDDLTRQNPAGASLWP